MRACGVCRKACSDKAVVEGCRAIGYTLGVPAVGMLGVVDDMLVDRALIPDRATAAQELAYVADVQPAAPHVGELALRRQWHGLRGQLVPRHLPPFMARRAKRPWLPRMAPHTRRSIRARFT